MIHVLGKLSFSIDIVRANACGHAQVLSRTTITLVLYFSDQYTNCVTVSSLWLQPYAMRRCMTRRDTCVAAACCTTTSMASNAAACGDIGTSRDTSRVLRRIHSPTTAVVAFTFFRALLNIRVKFLRMRGKCKIINVQGNAKHDINTTDCSL